MSLAVGWFCVGMVGLCRDRIFWRAALADELRRSTAPDVYMPTGLAVMCGSTGCCIPARAAEILERHPASETLPVLRELWQSPDGLAELTAWQWLRVVESSVHGQLVLVPTVDHGQGVERAYYRYRVPVGVGPRMATPFGVSKEPVTILLPTKAAYSTMP